MCSLSAYKTCFIAGNSTIGRWRLVGSINSNEGRVEYRFDDNDSWKGVVMQISQRMHAHIMLIERICQNLGYPTYVSYYQWNKFGEGDGVYYQMGYTYNIRKKNWEKPLSLRCSHSKCTIHLLIIMRKCQIK